MVKFSSIYFIYNILPLEEFGGGDEDRRESVFSSSRARVICCDGEHPLQVGASSYQHSTRQSNEGSESKGKRPEGNEQIHDRANSLVASDGSADVNLVYMTARISSSHATQIYIKHSIS